MIEGVGESRWSRYTNAARQTCNTVCNCKKALAFAKGRRWSTDLMAAIKRCWSVLCWTAEVHQQKPPGRVTAEEVEENNGERREKHELELGHRNCVRFTSYWKQLFSIESPGLHPSVPLSGPHVTMEIRVRSAHWALKLMRTPSATTEVWTHVVLVSVLQPRDI